MANSIRNILTVYGPLDETDRFIGRFTRGGMEGFVPIPTDYVPTGEGLPLGPENGWDTKNRWSDTWGACPEYGDFEILTDTSIVAGQHDENGSRPHIESIRANWVNYNKFTLGDHHKRIQALELPGFLGQDKMASALIVFHTKWKFPFRWIESVINAEYAREIVIHMLSYDIMANYFDPEDLVNFPDTPLGWCNHFHSFTSGGAEHIQSGHCAILIKEESGPVPTFEEINNGDHDPTLPSIDDEGNELADLCITVPADCHSVDTARELNQL